MDCGLGMAHLSVTPLSCFSFLFLCVFHLVFLRSATLSKNCTSRMFVRACYPVAHTCATSSTKTGSSASAPEHQAAARIRRDETHKMLLAQEHIFLCAGFTDSQRPSVVRATDKEFLGVIVVKADENNQHSSYRNPQSKKPKK